MICHHHRCIFVHIERTGGTSIELALSGFDWWEKATRTEKHLTAQGCIRRYGERMWRRYFTFSVVRNPWDLVVSSYVFFQARQLSGLSFRDFVLTSREQGDRRLDRGDWIYSRWWRRFGRCQLDWISDRNGKVLVDYIGRFEHLQREFGELCRRIGIAPAPLAHESRMEREAYAAYYDEETREVVATRFRRDIEAFAYEFGS